MTVTLKDIARLADIDAGAVSRTLRNHPKAQELRPETRERILKIAKDLGYQCNLLASSIRTGRVTTMAVIGRFAQENVDSSDNLILSGIFKEATANDYGIKVFDDSDLPRTFAEIAGNRIQLVASLSVAEDARIQTAELCRKNGLHLVFLYEHSHAGFPAVILDNADGAVQAVRLLAELGHRRIALLCVPHRFHYVRERHRGYLEGMKQAGLPVDPELASCTDAAEDAVRRMLSLPQKKRPTAIFGIADNLAIIAQNTALRMGFRIPEELSTIGFGAIDAGTFCYCRLTTICENLAMRGKLAVRLLLGKSVDITPDANGNYLIRPSLIRRDSAGTIQ